jgi:hypothetical protein
MLTERDEKILKTIHFYRFMSVIDVSYRLFKPGAKTHVRDILSNLCGKADEQDNQYLYRFGIPTASKSNVERIFTLGEQGYKFLREGGYIADNIRFRRRTIDNLNYNYLIHNLAITRFLVAAYWWSKQQDTYTLIDTRISHEIVGKANEIIPDGWLLFERKDGMRGALILEIDRGTEFQQQFKAHVLARLIFIESGADQKFFWRKAHCFCPLCDCWKNPLSAYPTAHNGAMDKGGFKRTG